ncbi:alpha/beta hydrolase [Streptomyces asiaticus]|uniref:Alpha/beta hydrolase n=3 Tax=Streptomyces TaxID=1883 RepID=A0ABN1RIC1_9ACTN
MRANAARMVRLPPEELSRNATFDVVELYAPGRRDAPDVRLLICRPTAVAGTVPVIYWIHGGGMIAGTNQVGIDEALDYAEHLQAAVVPVEYRLAPEHPHPAPVEDCYTGLLWTVEHAEQFGFDPTRLVVCGVSAGGGLAGAVTLMARDQDGPVIAGQLLMCPMPDDRNDSVSSHQMAGLGVWDRTSNQTGWTALLGAACGGDDVPVYAAPARAVDLSGLPPTYIDVGSAETFRDESVSYASRIWQAGGSAELHVWPGGFHGYAALAPTTTLSLETIATRTRWLDRLLSTT